MLKVSKAVLALASLQLEANASYVVPPPPDCNRDCASKTLEKQIGSEVTGAMCVTYEQLSITASDVNACAKLVEGAGDRCKGGNGYFFYGVMHSKHKECSCCTTDKATTDVRRQYEFNVYHLDAVTKAWSVDDIHYEIQQCTTKCEAANQSDEPFLFDEEMCPKRVFDCTTLSSSEYDRSAPYTKKTGHCKDQKYAGKLTNELGSVDSWDTCNEKCQGSYRCVAFEFWETGHVSGKENFCQHWFDEDEPNVYYARETKSSVPVEEGPAMRPGGMTPEFQKIPVADSEKISGWQSQIQLFYEKNNVKEEVPGCCRALTASCLAGCAGKTITEYCKLNPKTSGCDAAMAPAVDPAPTPEPQTCCMAMTASCLACSKGQTVEEYCKTNEKTDGCEDYIPQEKSACCEALTAECLACSQGLTTADYCQKNPTTDGCKPPAPPVLCIKEPCWTMFQPMYYKTQVVAGTNYEIIIKVSEQATILVKLWEKLDRTIQVNSIEDKPAGYTGNESGGPDPVDTTVGICHYIGPDPCYSICEKSLPEASLICNDYCHNFSELQPATSTDAVKSTYQKCFDSNCSGLKEKAITGQQECQTKCKDYTNNMKISSDADKTLYYNFCYKTNCEATYGQNPDLDGSQVDVACKNGCISSVGRQKDSALYTKEYFQAKVNECYAYSCIQKDPCEFYGFKDCFNYNGYKYSSKDQCQQTCKTNTAIDWRTQIKNECQKTASQMRSYDSATRKHTDYTDAQKDIYFTYCTESRFSNAASFASSLGCFMEGDDRDLEIRLGTDLTWAECHDAGKKRGLNFVGISNGNECWGSLKIGKYPKVAAQECSKDCPKDQSKKCGDHMRSNIYDIRAYGSTPNFEKCKGKRPVNCSLLGGYDLKNDVCYTTCMEVDEKKVCNDKCRATTVRAEFEDYRLYAQALNACYGVCNGTTKCPARYVDCSARGGYDPQDPCRQTCLKKEGENDEETCKTKCIALTQTMRFIDEASRQKYIQTCQAECMVPTGPNQCESYKTTSKKLANIRLDGSQEFQITMQIATDNDGAIFIKTDFTDDDLWTKGATVFSVRDGKLAFIYWGQKRVAGRAKVTDGRMHTIAVRYVKDEAWSFYVDGELDFRAKGNSQDIAGQYFRIGTDAGWAGPAFPGKITCVKYSTQTRDFDKLLKTANVKEVSPPVIVDDFDMLAPIQLKDPTSTGDGQTEGVICIKRYVDCSMFGGYDPKDPCKQTCLRKQDTAEFAACQNKCQNQMAAMSFSSTEAEQEYYQSCQDDCNETAIGCTEKCRADMSTMRFVDSTAQKSWYSACSSTCKAQTEKATLEPGLCTGLYVNCSDRGGYDPTDLCKTTCNWKNSNGQQYMKTAADTVKSEVSAATKSVIKYGERVEVYCQDDSAGETTCFDAANHAVIQLDDKPVEEAWSLGSSRFDGRPLPGTAPGGKDWNFDCNLLEKILMDNCWSSAVKMIGVSTSIFGLVVLLQ